MRVRWKAKSGYGDLISPICYAHNLSEHLGEKVELEFVHFNPKGVRDKYEADGTEEASFRGDLLFDLVSKGNSEVELLRTYDENMSVQHTNLFNSNKFHNYRLTSNNWSNNDNNTQESVTFITTENNKVPFANYPVPENKLWKDPVDNWSDIYNNFDNTQFVNYATPLADAIKILLDTKLVIGYHGSAMWLARFLGVPSVIISGNLRRTEQSFPNAVVVSTANDVVAENVDMYQKDAVNRTMKASTHGVRIWMADDYPLPGIWQRSLIP